MAVQKIPLETLQKVRQVIQSALVLPESENHPQSWSAEDQEPPEPDSLSDSGNLFNFGGLSDETTYAPNDQGQWFISTTNPAAALLKLPGLKLKAGLRLISYLYRNNADGIGTTWAVPEQLSTTAQLEKALADCGDQNHPPQPIGALADVMEAIEGDRSPLSFVIASILRRELKELGTLGKSCNWTHHRLINALPAQVNWQWRIQTPKDFSPKIQIAGDGRAAVEFFTCRIVAPYAIVQHIDQYPAEQYKATSLDRSVAVVQKG